MFSQADHGRFKVGLLMQVTVTKYCSVTPDSPIEPTLQQQCCLKCKKLKGVHLALMRNVCGCLPVGTPAAVILAMA